jgi:hypothetical protein
MLRRIGSLFKFIRGDFIVLKVDKDTLVIDAENFKKPQLQKIATTFFQKVYSL